MNSPWSGFLIGVAGLVVGLVGIILYLRSRVGARLEFQSRGLRLLGKESPALPKEVKFLFENKVVPRVTKTTVVFWNSGAAIVRGGDVVGEDPIRFDFDGQGEILTARVLKVTRQANKFSVDIDLTHPTCISVHFDYLDPGDGGVVEILHTSEVQFPSSKGSIRGVPRGVRNGGQVTETQLTRPTSKRWIKEWSDEIPGILLGGFMTVVGAATFFTSPGNGLVSGLLTAGGMTATLLNTVTFWRNRRRFPEALKLEIGDA